MKLVELEDSDIGSLDGSADNVSKERLVERLRQSLSW